MKIYFCYFPKFRLGFHWSDQNYWLKWNWIQTEWDFFILFSFWIIQSIEYIFITILSLLLFFLLVADISCALKTVRICWSIGTNNSQDCSKKERVFDCFQYNNEGDSKEKIHTFDLLHLRCNCMCCIERDVWFVEPFTWMDMSHIHIHIATIVIKICHFARLFFFCKSFAT